MILTELPQKMRNALDATITSFCTRPGIDKDRLMQTQVPIVEQILNAYLLNKKAFILEGPTGCGKSIIGILVAESIRRHDTSGDMKTYMLTSTKTLQDQLDKDISRFNLNWQVLKGQANYMCHINNKPYPQRECERMSTGQAEKNMECSARCGYIQARRNAIERDGAVMSYAYWLTSLNFVYERLFDNAPFSPRTLTIFDECHSITDIVQNMFSIVVSAEIMNRGPEMIDNILMDGPTDEYMKDLRTNFANISSNTEAFFDKSPVSMEDQMNRLLNLASAIESAASLISTHINAKFKRSEGALSPTEPHQFKLLKQYDRYLNTCGMLRFFYENNIKNVHNIVMTDEVDYMRRPTKRFRTLDEAYMVQRHAIRYTNFSLYMSATIGDIDTFARNAGITNYEGARLESDFDFSKSPIYKVTPMISMAYKYKYQNMQTMVDRINEIVERLHPNERGIIHTGNFEISNALKRCGNRRMKFYENSNEKQQILDNLKYYSNAIIVGPSLVEGIDLVDDLARFCILAKVPYPYLDEFNKRKMEMVPGWYDLKTSTQYMQAIGRPIRHRNDWAVTYLIDSCFDFFLKKVPMPGYLRHRISTFNYNSLFEQESNSAIDDLFSAI